MKFQSIHAAVNHRLSRGVVWFAILFGLAAVGLAPTIGNGLLQNSFPHVPPEVTRIPDRNQVDDINSQRAKQQSFEAANAERKKQIGDESAKLLKLATDLKTEVDKTSKDTLSLGVIRKADEIEKLAHDLKEKMKLTVGRS
jgi:hypothetical protein